MWISEQILASQAQRPQARLGEVTGKQGAGIAAQGAGEYRGLPLAGPWGIAYLPPDGARAVVLSGREGDACVGTIVPGMGLEAGELLLYSAGGARILLKNTGEVVVNGQVFAPPEAS